MKNSWERQRKISTLPNCRVTPDVALARSLEKAKAGKIKSVYIGIQFEDGSFDADWSLMAISELATHATVAHIYATKELTEDVLG